VVPPLPVAPLPLVVLLRTPRRRPRRRVRRDTTDCALAAVMLTQPVTEKEESDDDMGFGLFD